ncbi:hypothetical protein C4J81_12180 [Deltaproteobacteria bacterium Smac51]|nr:hypothetical protein C4J81_12180 [Deltaproteobacteria bacterium Smac51]
MVDMNTGIEPVICEGVIMVNRALSGDTFLMTIDCPEAAALAAPGRFVKVRSWAAPEEGGAPLLDRPFSIHHTAGSTLSLLYRVVGPGTALLSRSPAGSAVRVSGPFGRGLADVMEKPAPLYLAGGGIGLAPMRLAMNWAGPDNCLLFYGERSGAVQVDENWLKGWAGDFAAVTEDGSGYGRPGLVTAPLEEALAREPRPIFTCGPTPMLAAVSSLGQKYGVPVWASVEAGMACGFGVCLTCSLPLADGGRFRVCQEGPVVDGASVKWELVRS